MYSRHSTADHEKSHSIFEIADVEDRKCTHQIGWTMGHQAKSRKSRKVVGHMYHSENWARLDSNK